MIDMESSVVPSDEELREVQKLATKQEILQREIDNLEETLSERKEELRRVQQNELPEAMFKIGVSSFSLIGGKKVTIKEMFVGSLPKDPVKRGQGLTWLREHGHGDLIKCDVVAAFSKGEENSAKQLLSHCLDAGYKVNMTENVHHSTLKAFAKEALQSGVNIPEDILGVHKINKAEIK